MYLGAMMTKPYKVRERQEDKMPSADTIMLCADIMRQEAPGTADGIIRGNRWLDQEGDYY